MSSPTSIIATPESASSSTRGGSELASQALEMRPFPFPYRSMLALCSDLDETPNAEVYYRLMEFLNTGHSTAFGPGVDLEIGNSLYFDMAPGQVAYWNTDDRGRSMFRSLIQSGHIDCLHSFGDLADTRQHAARALEDLQRHDCQFRVWVDHAIAPTNFGSDIMFGHGDEPGHPAYHADLTRAHGIRYVWRGRVTSVVGQDRELSLGGIFNPSHPVKSTETVLREGAKQVLARIGSPKYALHRENRILNPCRLRDGAEMLEFLRCNPHWGGVSCCDTGRGVGEVLENNFLQRLVERQGFCILYTHLGKLHTYELSQMLPPSFVEGFRRLAEFYRREKILVTTTRRLLDFCQARSGVKARVSERGGRRQIHLEIPPRLLTGSAIRTHSELEGLTFYRPAGEPMEVYCQGQLMPAVRQNGPDETGRNSFSLPWSRLKFPGFA